MKGMVWQRDSTVGKMASHAGRVRRRYKRAVQGGRSLPEQNWKDQRKSFSHSLIHTPSHFLNRNHIIQTHIMDTL